MAIRLIVTITATPGNGAELAQAMAERCQRVAKEPGCEQFEVFQSAVDPDRLVLIERWTDQHVLDAHRKLNTASPQVRPDLRAGQSELEEYVHNRTR